MILHYIYLGSIKDYKPLEIYANRLLKSFVGSGVPTTTDTYYPRDGRLLVTLRTARRMRAKQALISVCPSNADCTPSDRPRSLSIFLHVLEQRVSGCHATQKDLKNIYTHLEFDVVVIRDKQSIVEEIFI